jgi:alginate O-acetyltransferase complex protein AlgI
VISSIVDFYVGQALGKATNPKKRKLLLATSLATNLGILGFFKYFNFFLENLVTSFGSLGIELHSTTLQIILPVGISFYTFQTLSYSIDIYRGKTGAGGRCHPLFRFCELFSSVGCGSD